MTGTPAAMRTDHLELLLSERSCLLEEKDICFFRDYNEECNM